MYIHSKLMSFQLGRSALMVAVQNKRRDVAALLLSAGANPDLQEEVRGAVGVCAIGRGVCTAAAYHRLAMESQVVSLAYVCIGILEKGLKCD